jgi:fido (protein-threonine AMPylation protein)
MQRQFVDPFLLREIDEKKEVLDSGESPCLSLMVRETLEEDALTHSDLLEATGKKQRRAREAVLRETHNSLMEAWKFAKASFNGQLTTGLILNVAEKVEPLSQGRYRSSDVRIQGHDVVLPVRAAKVVGQMETLTDYLNNSEGDLHPVERAALWHLHSTRIHPLEDGNGRTARLVTNLILDEEGYGPSTIQSGERIIYQGVLRSALRGYRDRESRLPNSENLFKEVLENPLQVSDEEHMFFNYLASKVNISLDKQISEMERFPVYEVRLDKSRTVEANAYRLKRVLGSHFRRNNKPGLIKVRGNGRLIIRGDIDESALRVLLEKGSDSKYSLKKR